MATPKVSFRVSEVDVDDLCEIDIPPLPNPLMFKPSIPTTVLSTDVDQSVPMDCTPDGPV